jgi:hypothetical protein
MNCRYCFEESYELFSICSCDGTIKYVHKSCLLRWLKIRNIYTHNNIYTQNCEICHTDFSFIYYNYSAYNSIIILFVFYATLLYIPIIFLSYLYCIEVYIVKDCQNLNNYNIIILYILLCLSICLYLQSFLEEYFRYEYIKFL